MATPDPSTGGAAAATATADAPPLPPDPRTESLAERIHGFLTDGLIAGGNGHVEVAGVRTLRLIVACTPRLSRPTLHLTLDSPWKDHVDVMLPLLPYREWAPQGTTDLGALLASTSALAAVRLVALEDADGPWLVAHTTAPRAVLEDAASGPRVINALLQGARSLMLGVNSLAVARFKRVPCNCPASASDAAWIQAHGFSVVGAQP